MCKKYSLLCGAIRFVVFILFLSVFIGSASAQDNLTGRIYENKTKVLLPGINIQNLRTQRTYVSDGTGAFSIPAKVGDLVVFSGFSYRSDTLYVKDLKYTEILMGLKSTTLNEVKVTGVETKVGSLKAQPTLSPFNSKTVVYQQDSKGNYVGGLTVNMFDSHSAENKRKKEAQFNKDEKVKSQIAEIFSADNLKNYVPLKGQEMQNFITTYTPDIRTFTDDSFNLTLYLNKAYTEFMKLPAEDRQSANFQKLY